MVKFAPIIFSVYRGSLQCHKFLNTTSRRNFLYEFFLKLLQIQHKRLSLWEFLSVKILNSRKWIWNFSIVYIAYFTFIDTEVIKIHIKSFSVYKLYFRYISNKLKLWNLERIYSIAYKSKNWSQSLSNMSWYHLFLINNPTKGDTLFSDNE